MAEALRGGEVGEGGLELYLGRHDSSFSSAAVSMTRPYVSQRSSSGENPDRPAKRRPMSPSTEMDGAGTGMYGRPARRKAWDSSSTPSPATL